jgi:hypothetical protein
LEISACKLPHSRCTASPLPSSVAPACKARTLCGCQEAFVWDVQPVVQALYHTQT